MKKIICILLSAIMITFAICDVAIAEKSEYVKDWLMEETDEGQTTLEYTGEEKVYGIALNGKVYEVVNNSVTVETANLSASFTAIMSPIGKIIVSKSTVLPSETKQTVKINVSIVDNTGFIGGKLKISYNNDYLALKSAERGETAQTLSDASAAISGSTKSPYTVCFENDTAKNNIETDGTFAVLTFEVKANTPEGTYPISVEYNCDKYDFIDKDLNKVYFQIKNGTVLVGDSNENISSLDDFVYSVSENEVTLEKYIGTDSIVRINDLYQVENEKSKITTISETAFEGDTNVKTVIIPASTETIESNAFAGCTSLEKLVIYGNPSIENNAIEKNSALTIKGWRGDSDTISNAQAYAQNAGITFTGLESFIFRGFQYSDMSGENFNIRFVSGIDGIDYKNIGYEIKESTTGKNWSSKSNTVYQSLNGKTSDGKQITAVTAKQFGDTYLYAYAIKNVPTNTALSFEIKTYVENNLGAWIQTGLVTVNISKEGSFSYDYSKIDN